MRLRRIGQTALALSEIGFGCGGNAGLMVRGTAQEQRRIVERAIDLGINYFDNSPDYGAGVAEENLGRALREVRPLPVLNSKVEIRQADLADVAGHVVRSAEASLRRLGVDCIDVFQIHNGPVAEPPVMAGAYYRTLGLGHFAEAMDGLRRLLRDGKIRHAGFICRGRDASEVRRMLDSGLFDLVNLPYTLLNPTAGNDVPAGMQVERDFGGVIGLAQARHVGVAVHSALAGGALTDASVDGGERHPLARAVDTAAAAARRNRERAASLRFLARATGTTLAQAAFRFVLSHPGVTTALGGFSSLAQLEEIAAVPALGAFPADLMARLEDVWQSNFGLA